MQVAFTKFSGNILFEVLAILVALAIVLLSLFRARKPIKKELKEALYDWLNQKD